MNQYLINSPSFLHRLSFVTANYSHYRESNTYEYIEIAGYVVISITMLIDKSMLRCECKRNLSAPIFNSTYNPFSITLISVHRLVYASELASP